jgi:hypothetical protein
VKGEHGERQHLPPTSSFTQSGINVRGWSHSALAVNQAFGRVNGPALCDDNGLVSKTSDVDETFHELLGEICVEHPAHFQADIKSSADIEHQHSVFRSLRRGPDSHAIAMKIAEADVKVVNRWSKKEASGAGKMSMDMTQHCADVHIPLPAFLRCIGAV